MNIRTVFQRVTQGCLVAVLAAGVLGCEDDDDDLPAPVDVSGIWVVSGIWNNRAEVKFEQSGSYVTAIVAKDQTFLEFTGDVSGDTLSGVFVPTSSAQPITINATVSGSLMRGWWIISPDTGPFTATRK